MIINSWVFKIRSLTLNWYSQDKTNFCPFYTFNRGWQSLAILRNTQQKICKLFKNIRAHNYDLLKILTSSMNYNLPKVIWYLVY